MFSDLHKKASDFLSANASTILTAGGVVGTVATAVLTGRAAVQAKTKIEEINQDCIKEETKDLFNTSTSYEEFKAAIDKIEPLSRWDICKLTGVYFIPPVLTGAATVGSIVFANRMSAQKAAALAAAYGASAKQRDELRAKLEEKLGVKKSEQARTEIEEERTRNHDREVTDRAEMIIVSGGAVLCYDTFSDRYVRTTAEKIREAEKKCKETVESLSECELGVFYKMLGFDRTSYNDMLGWNLRNPPNITIDTILVNDEPCLCIDFVNLPFADWKSDY